MYRCTHVLHLMKQLSHRRTRVPPGAAGRSTLYRAVPATDTAVYISVPRYYFKNLA
eukprot:SAG31_NODE_18954_length_587_cov_2.268859_1_plen_56_part_00